MPNTALKPWLVSIRPGHQCPRLSSENRGVPEDFVAGHPQLVFVDARNRMVAAEALVEPADTSAPMGALP